MPWPNDATWCADQDQQTVSTSEGAVFIWTVDCGTLKLPSGRLVACDLAALADEGDNYYVAVPPGEYRVTVTLADVSPEQDRSIVLEAYATVRLAGGVDSYRRVLALRFGDEPEPVLADDEFSGFAVDTAAACLVDDSVAYAFTEEWYRKMLATEEDLVCIYEGIANVPLPPLFVPNGENIIVISSGIGDGVYPLVGSFDKADRLIAVHIDFLALPLA